MRRKGMTTMQMFTFTFTVFFLLVFMGLALIVFTTINDILNMDVDIGQTNLQEINQDSFGKITTGLLNNADIICLAIIFGQMISMFMIGYLFGDDNKLWIPTDLIILIFIMIFSIYLAQAYQLVINTPSSLFNVYSDNLTKSSLLLLNLPELTGIIGALLMIFTYTKFGYREGLGSRETRGGFSVSEF